MAGGVDIGTLKGKLTLEDQYTSKVEQAVSATEKAHKAVEGMGPAVRNLAAGLGVAAGAALKMSVDFNASMANVATIIPNNVARIEELKDAVQDMAVQTGKDTKDLADGLYQVVSTFGDTAETVRHLEIAAKAATAGLSTTEEAINLIAAVTKGYGDTSAEAAQHAADLAFQTANLGITNFPQLASAIGGVIPLAATLGVKQEELFAGFATLSGITGSTSEVSTQFASILTAMIKPTEEMSSAVAKLGFSSAKALVETKGMAGAVQALVSTTDGSQEAIAGLFGRVEALTPVLALTGAQAGAMAKNIGEMGKVAGVTEQALAQQTQGVNKAGFAYLQFRQQIVTSMQDIGDAILKNLPTPLAIAAQAFVETGTKALEYSGQIAQVVTALNQVKIAQVAATNATIAGGGAAATAAGGWKTAAAAIAGSGGFVAAITAASAGILYYMGQQSVWMNQTMRNVGGPMGALFGALTEQKAALNTAADAMKNVKAHATDIHLAWTKHVGVSKGASDSYSVMAAELGKVRDEVSRLLPEQRAAIDAQAKLGISAKDIADRMSLIPGAVQVTEEAVTMYMNRVEEATKSTQKLSDETARLAESLSGLGDAKSGLETLEALRKIGSVEGIDPAKAGEIIESFEKTLAVIERLGPATVGATDQQVIAIRNMVAILKPVEQTWKDQQKAIEEWSESSVNEIDKLAARLEEFQEASASLEEQIQDLADELTLKKATVGMSSAFRDLIKFTMDSSRELKELESAARSAEGTGLEPLYDRLLALKREAFARTFAEMSIQVKDLTNVWRGIFPFIGQVHDMILATTEDAEEGTKKATRETISWSESLGTLSSAMADLAQSTGQATEGWLHDVAEIIGLMNVAAKSVEGLNKAFEKRDAKGNLVEGEFDFGSLGGADGFGQGVAAYGQLAQAAIGAAGAMSTATNVAGRGNRAMRGAMTGLAIGTNPILLALTGGNSAWIGPAIGAIVGALRNPAFEQHMKRIGNEWGIFISEELAKEIEKTSKAIGDKSTAELLHFSDLLQAAGGPTVNNIDMFSHKLRDLFSLIEAGRIETEDASKIIEQNFTKMAEVATSKGKLINDSLRDVMMLDAQMGTGSQAIRDFSNQRLASGLNNIAAFLGIAGQAKKALDSVVKDREAAQKRLDELDKEAKDIQGKEGGPGAGDKKRLEEIAQERVEAQKGLDEIVSSSKNASDILAAMTIRTQEGASAMALSITGSVALMRQQGMSLVEALTAASPAIQNLKEQLQATGFDGGAAFADLEAKMALLGDKVAGPVLEGMASLGDGISDLYNGGLLTVDMFKGMADQIAFTRESLIAQGKDSQQINEIMAPQLQNIWEIQQKWNVELDATTEKMLEEAKAAGLVGDKFKSSGERTVDALGKVVNRLDLLLKALGVEVPKAIDEATDAMSEGAEEMVKDAGEAAGEISKKYDNLKDRIKDHPILINWDIEDLKLPQPDPIVVPVEYDAEDPPWQENMPPPPATPPGGETAGEQGYAGFNDGRPNWEGMASEGRGDDRLQFVGMIDDQVMLRFIAERTPEYVNNRVGTTVKAY